MSDKPTMHIQTGFGVNDDDTQAREFQLPAEVPLVNVAYNSSPQDPENYDGQAEPDTATLKLIYTLDKLREASEITEYALSRGRVTVRSDVDGWADDQLEKTIIEIISEVAGVDEFDIVRHS